MITRTTTATHGRDRMLALTVAAATVASLGLTAGGLGLAALSRGDQLAPPAAAPITGAEARQASARLGPAFEPNVGQTAAQVSYLTRVNGATVFLMPTGAVFATPGHSPAVAHGKVAVGPAAPGYAMQMQVVGSNAQASATADNALPGKANYFIGKDPAKWHPNVPTFGQVAFHDVYPGINLVWYGNKGQLEYDFVVAAGADPAVIHMAFAGATAVTVDAATGDLLLATPIGQVRQHAPRVFQDVAGARSAVQGSFVIRPGGQVGFDLGAYDHSQPLDIDPSIVYSTHIGGSGEDGDSAGTATNPMSLGGAAIDQSGNTYVVSTTNSVDFPVTPGAYQASPEDQVVAKLNQTGTALVYATYVGSAILYGFSHTAAFGIAVNSQGSAVISGTAEASDYPTTPGALQTSPAGPCGCYMPFVTKLSPTGSSLDYSTFVGDAAYPWAPTYDASGDVLVAGTTLTTVPTTAGAFQEGPCTDGNGCGFLLKLNPTGSALVYGTLLPVDCNYAACAVAVDAGGDAFVAARNLVVKVNPSGSALLYSTTLLSPGTTKMDGITVDGAGNAYITGATRGGLAVTPGALMPTLAGHQTLIAKLDPSGTRLLYATYFGAPTSTPGTFKVDGNDPGGIALTPSGDIWITGWMFDAAQFPSKDGVQERCGCFTNFGAGNAYVAKIRPAGHGASDLLFATIVGGNSNTGPGVLDGIALDAHGDVYVSGWTQSQYDSFPSTPGAFQRSSLGMDRYVTKISGQVCDTNITGNVTGDVVVGAGSVGCLYHAKVSGSVTVKAGGDLSIDNSTVSGSVTATNAKVVTVCATTVGAGLSASGTTGFLRVGSGDAPGSPGCFGDHISGNVVLKNNKGGVEFGGDHVTGNVTVTGTTGTPLAEDLNTNPEVEHNVISGNLACSGNNPAPVNDMEKNKVSSASIGQCAAL